MVVVLMGAGVAALVGGLLAVAISISIRDFSFGATLMIVGSIGAACGLVVIALAQVIREIRRISPAPANVSTAQRPEFPPRPVPPTATMPPADMPFPVPPRAPAQRAPLPPDQAQAPEAPRTPAPSKRNLLFRPPRPADSDPVPAADDGQSAPADLAPRPDVSWPEPAPKPAEGLWKRRRRSEPETPPAAPMLDLASESADQEPRVTVLKSGVVDGMAYTLYSDGSIEAQLTEGTVRFASIDALRQHLDRPA